MKKIIVVSVAFLTAIFFVSCAKSGVYKPKDKINAVWFESEKVTTIDTVSRTSNTERFLREEWKWEDKMLRSRTVYRTNGEIRYNYNYEYNSKNKIIGITSDLSTERKTRIRFIYDDDTKKLKEVKYFTEDFSENNLPYKKLEFTYDGNKVIAIKETVNTHRYPRSYANAEMSLLPFLVSEDMAESIAVNTIHSKVEYDVVTREYVFEWKKKNISDVTITTTSGGVTSEARISYTYDEKRNPQLARVMGYVEEGSIDCIICSKNNVVSCNYQEENYSYSEESQYTYDGKTPIEKVVTRNEKNSFSTVRVTEKWTYEYEE
ncbi:MAG: hypothetical protein IK025_12985 [Bacteroidales bacterium]|nr:hypothetical protein [Bacteroidales bacterium]